MKSALQEDVKLGPVGPGMQRSQSMKSPVGRKGSAARNRTSRYIGVGSSNRKNQWQARILVHGKVGRPTMPLPWHIIRIHNPALLLRKSEGKTN